MADLMYYLQRAVNDRASDLFFIAGSPACEKLDKNVQHVDEEFLYSPQTEDLVKQIYVRAGRAIDRLLEHGDDDFSFAVPGLARFRVNTYRQRGSLAAVVRVVSFTIPNWQELHIPEQVLNLANKTSGLILVTGTAGSGKSTTQACIINQINHTRACHIVTLEDPIEYLHRNQLSIISQREIAIDTNDYLSALRACLRQAPDVILLGEMRDHETIRTAMTAAETGHLVIATLHTNGAVNTIDRIIDSFPDGQQSQIRLQLSMVISTVVSQQLLPALDGSLIPAFEIMHNDSSISNMIRDNKTHQINNNISTGSRKGMISMDQSILALYNEGKISKQTAIDYAANRDEMKNRLS